MHPRCRSSELLIEWEARLGCQLPFRQAEDAMDFFSHGAIRTEDTTIARHLGVVGGLVDRSWTCRTPEEVKEFLANAATRDRQNGKPLLYVSSDAHALRRYVDDNPNRTVHTSNNPHGAGEAFVWQLLESKDPSDTALDDLLAYLAENTDRTDYPAYRRRGMQIGSGAMESLHRVASQMRLKLAGARWTAERALAVLNTRLMLLAGRWDAFWSRPDLATALREAFTTPPVLAP